ncbi:MAG: hypothetical protein AB2803_15865 [Candidatus Thiodiazotropha sp.]
MNKKEPEAFAHDTAQTLKTEKDLNEFRQILKKVTVEAALSAELDKRPGYDKYERTSSSNSRNCFTRPSRLKKACLI